MRPRRSPPRRDGCVSTTGSGGVHGTRYRRRRSRAGGRDARRGGGGRGWVVYSLASMGPYTASKIRGVRWMRLRSRPVNSRRSARSTSASMAACAVGAAAPRRFRTCDRDDGNGEELFSEADHRVRSPLGEEFGAELVLELDEPHGSLLRVAAWRRKPARRNRIQGSRSPRRLVTSRWSSYSLRCLSKQADRYNSGSASAPRATSISGISTRPIRPLPSRNGWSLELVVGERDRDAQREIVLVQEPLEVGEGGCHLVGRRRHEHCRRRRCCHRSRPGSSGARPAGF